MKYTTVPENGMLRIIATRYISRFLITTGECGGLIEKESNLSQEGDCWIHSNARVYGDAQVHGNAQIHGKARIFGNARVLDTARISGDARISGKARVYENVQVTDKACVYGNAHVSGNASIFDRARVYGNAQVHDNVQVHGNARVYGNVQVLHRSVVTGDIILNKSVLSVNRSDGWTFLVAPTKEGYAITAGCRHFTSFEAAREHWKHRQGTLLGEETDMILNVLEQYAINHVIQKQSQ